MFQRVLLSFAVLALTYAIMVPLVAQVGQSLNESAQMITDASGHGGR